MTTQKPVLVTGATGFIGCRLVARLLGDGHLVRALVLPDESVDNLWPGAVEVVRGDVTDPQSCMLAAQGVGIVFHLAALVGDWGPRELFRRVTVYGTENVLLAAAQAGARAVLASSVVFYGADVGREICTEDRPAGKCLGPYSWSKQQQEVVAARLVAEHGLQLSIVRPTNVYGAGSGPWVDEVVGLLRKGEPTLIGKGDQNAGLVHVDNVVDIMVRAATQDAALGRVYNACDGLDVTWRQYFSALAAMIDAQPPSAIPVWMAQVGAVLMETLWKAFRRPNRPLLTREALNLVGSNLRVPNDRAREELGFEPCVSYDAGLKEIADYLNNQGTA